MRGWIFMLLGASCATPAWADAPPIRPGLWEFAMVGMAHKQNVCIKPEMAKDIQQLAQKSDPGGDCKTFDQSKKGNVQSFKVSCTKPQKYEATVTTNLMSADNFSLQHDYNMERDGRAQKGSMKINYKRLGDC
ncbi:MAG TPA: DUF3617 family protein [Burkholderiales bacterium]|nr:DUF3617 family protein [Burkholderiales bacterium]